MNRHTGTWRLGFVAGISLLLASSLACTQELRDGIVSGASSFAADATYGLLSELLPFPVTPSTSPDTNGDPFDDDQPLQM